MFDHLFYLLSVKSNVQLLLYLGFLRHMNLSLSPCFSSLLFCTLQTVVSNKIYIPKQISWLLSYNTTRSAGWSAVISDFQAILFKMKGLIDLHRVVIGTVCVMCAAKQHSYTTESIQTSVLWLLFSQPPRHI